MPSGSQPLYLDVTMAVETTRTVIAWNAIAVAQLALPAH
jgi:hypothetical protein